MITKEEELILQAIQKCYPFSQETILSVFKKYKSYDMLIEHLDQCMKTGADPVSTNQHVLPGCP